MTPTWSLKFIPDSCFYLIRHETALEKRKEEVGEAPHEEEQGYDEEFAGEGKEDEFDVGDDSEKF